MLLPDYILVEEGVKFAFNTRGYGSVRCAGACMRAHVRVIRDVTTSGTDANCLSRRDCEE